MTLQERVESYIGTVSLTTVLDSFLQEGARLLIDILPREMAIRFASPEAVDDRGITVRDVKRVVSADYLGIPAIEIPPEESTRAITSGSLFERTTLDPVWYVNDGVAFITPTGANNRYLRTITYPTVIRSDATISTVPSPLLPAIGLYAAIQCLRAKIDTLITSIGAENVTLRSLPTPPSSPSYTWDPSELGTLDPTVISAFSGPPVYSSGGAPSLTTEYANIVTYLNTQEDIELGSAEMNKAKLKLEEFSAKMQDAMNEVQRENIAFQADVQRLIRNGEMAQARLTAIFTTTSDINMQNAVQGMQATISLFRDQLSLYAQEVQAWVGEASTLIQRLTGIVGKIMAQVKATFDEIAGLQMEFDRILIMTGLVKNDPPANG